MNQAIHTPPSDTWLKPRVEGGIVTPVIRDIYLHALECMRQAIQSPYDRLIQDRYTGGWHDCEGRFAPPSAAREKIPYWYNLPYESNKLGDFIRVLRNRPCKMGVVPQLEYVPNSTYSFAMVKTILKDYTDVKVKGSRFWDDQIVRPVANKILYSLHDYCPGMPVNLEQECKNMNLDPYRHTELVVFPPNTVERYPLDLQGTMEKMVSLGIIKDAGNGIQQFLIDLKPTIQRYSSLADTWPFELPRMFLSVHLARLDRIKHALTKYLESQGQDTLDKALDNTPAQSGGQDGVPNGNSQKQSRQDLSRGGSSQ
jgi:hypothetical protein